MVTPSPLNIRELLSRYRLQPDKRLGQNFLEDDTALQAIVEAAAISPSDIVLEIGPGLGSLTRHLASQANQVIAVELDDRFMPVLGEVLANYLNTRLVQGDILKLNPATLVGKTGYIVVANIPYYITSALIRHLLEAEMRPARLVLTVQREVAERICAGPGRMSLLALSVQVYGQPKIAFRIPAGAFYPAPKVDSAVVRIDIYPATRLEKPVTDVFFRLAKAGFSQKRKTLRNALGAGMGWTNMEAEDLLEAAQIDSKRRAETLDLGEWDRLAQLVYREHRKDP
jgi:16S rRNA (adenine1518-N6/adenine1519-N6)-dimethyltransferase